MLCGELGWENVATYIQSGNVVFEAAGRAAALEAALEHIIEHRFGSSTPVIIRSAAVWDAYPASNPFGEAAEKEPNRLMLMLSKQPPGEGAAAALQERAKAGERLKLRDDALWIHYPNGAGTSKLSPSLMNRLVGSPVTARNWNTVLKLQAMANR